ncbi:hypothetical protein DER44DRAFT_206296 [Fusarium oxysporum]|nr:hypothetical protein DER44DRAFT_206296 [Fusarium oxysporum]
MTNSLSISIHGFLLGFLPLMAQASPNVWRLKANPPWKGKKKGTHNVLVVPTRLMSGRSHRHPSNFPPTFIGFRRDWESACGIVLCTYLPTLLNLFCSHCRSRCFSLIVFVVAKAWTNIRSLPRIGSMLESLESGQTTTTPGCILSQTGLLLLRNLQSRLHRPSLK